MAIKNYSIKLSILILFIIVIILSGCFSHWQGDSAKVVISFGRADRAVYYDPNDSAVLQRLEHKIKFTNDVKTLEFTSNGGTTIEIYAEPGDWSVEIVSWLDGDVYAKGEKDVSLKLGLNNETIEMNRAHLVKFIPGGDSAIQEQVIYHAMKIDDPPDDPTNEGWFDDSFTEPLDLNEVRIFESVTFYTKWSDLNFKNITGTLQYKLDWINKNAIDGGYYVVTVDDDENILPPTTLSRSGKTVTITLKSNDDQEKKINLSDIGTLFSVGSGVILILDNNITLEGKEDNEGCMIFINEKGKLIINAGSKITNNIRPALEDKNQWIAGVYVNNNAAFVMNGGEISGIEAPGGGAVWVQGTFTMNGGKICNNKSTENSGGGVWALKGGIFNMNDGEISGNTAMVYDGGGVHVYNGGTFYMRGGTISGNTAEGKGGGVSVWVQGDNDGNPPANSTFNMTGGTISGNKAITENGGGVNVGTYDNTFYSTFNMISGTISGNTTEKGGGGVSLEGEKTIFNMNGGKIYKNNSLNNDHVGGGGVFLNKGTFTMEKGEISGNTAAYWAGGGVKVVYGTFNMNGGIITGNIAQWGGGIEVWHGIFKKAAKADGGIISGNIATYADGSNAISANNENDLLRKNRNSNIRPNEALSYDGPANTASSTGWE
jgi:hypothetical protein